MSVAVPILLPMDDFLVKRQDMWKRSLRFILRMTSGVVYSVVMHILIITAFTLLTFQIFYTRGGFDVVLFFNVIGPSVLYLVFGLLEIAVRASFKDQMCVTFFGHISHMVGSMFLLTTRDNRMRLSVQSPSCYNWSNPEEAREKLEGEFSRATIEVAPISFNGGAVQIGSPTGHTTHEMRQRLRGHTKPTVRAMEQGKWSAGGVMTPRKQATQIGKRELRLNAGDAFTAGCPQNPSKTAEEKLYNNLGTTQKRRPTGVRHDEAEAVTAATRRAFQRDSDLGSDPDPSAIGD
ncbi:hypothetical protein HID58_009694 [Brassica napus]|uniref:Uncharacterized protein n=1 Tax=Brassica napus TaxID=3708 RepID=A0ABQ8DT68_BRANA|nr:hypothetical protein HID58_009694 [Brassica napus]